MHKFTWLVSVLIVCTSCVSSGHIKTGQSAFNILELSIEQAHEAFRQKRISCEQLTRRYLERIEKLDQPSKLNAVIYINPNAINRAKDLDTKLAETGQMRKLYCIPVILKDNFGTHDMPTEAGSVALKGFLPPEDAEVVKELRAEDAIVIAKSNMDEWAFSPYHTISSTHGETRNAYNLGHVPAGSSGGTASAIAANFGIIGIGTDTGSSIRGPASHLSLVGFRPTIGTVSPAGIIPLLSNRDIAGPITRTVLDAVTVFSVINDKNRSKPETKKMQPDVFARHLKQTDINELKGVRFGVIRQLYDTPTSDFEVMEIMQKAIEDLKRAGAELVDPFVIPDFKRLTREAVFCSRFYFDLNNYLRTQKGSAPLNSFEEVVRNRAYLDHNQGFINWVMNGKGNPESQQPPCSDVQGDVRRKHLLDVVVTAMDKHHLDAIIYPSWSNPPREIGDMESPHGENSSEISPHTGQPSITVPMGFTEAGLPVGLEFLARPYDDYRLLQYAYTYEKLTRHRRPPELFSQHDAD